MIEIPEADRVRSELDRLVGIDECVSLDVGGNRVRAPFDDRQFEADRISAVQYVKFPLGRKLSAAFQDEAVPVILRVDHPEYAAEQPIEGEPRASLARDLAAENLGARAPQPPKPLRMRSMASSTFSCELNALMRK